MSTPMTKAEQEAAMWATRAQAKHSSYGDPRLWLPVTTVPAPPPVIIPSHAAATRAITEARGGNAVALAMLREVAAGGKPTMNGEHAVMRVIHAYLATVRG